MEKPASTANRGKVAEKEVKRRLEQLSVNSEIAAYRLPDARAGSFTPTLADFLVVQRGEMCLLEIKETQHDYRLPHANFGKDQVARMQRFQLAGAKAYVLVYHSTLKKWRKARLDYFQDRQGGSWDLRDLPLWELKDILSIDKL